MKFEIPFNPDFFRRQNLILWNSIWKKNLDKNARNLVIGLLGIAVSIPLFSSQVITATGFLFLGLFYFFSCLNYFLYSRKSKKKFLKILEEEIDGHLQHNSTCIWEFAPDHFHYSDYRMDQKIQWFAFSGYEVVQNVLLLKLKNNLNPTYLLEGAEVGEENFVKIIDFLSEKIKSESPQLV